MKGVEVSEVQMMPLGDRVIVAPDTGDEVTPGGVIIPEMARGRSETGTVVAVGPGAKNEKSGEYMPLQVKEGDEVYFTKYGGTEISSQGEDLLLLREHDLLAVKS